jgi:hypothetical protein
VYLVCKTASISLNNITRILQANAVKFEDGKVLCVYVGGGEEKEWVALNSNRLVLADSCLWWA